MFHVITNPPDKVNPFYNKFLASLELFVIMELLLCKWLGGHLRVF